MILSTNSCVFLELVESSSEGDSDDSEDESEEEEEEEEEDDDDELMSITSSSSMSWSDGGLKSNAVSSSIASLSTSMVSRCFRERAAPSACLSVYASLFILSVGSLVFFCCVLESATVASGVVSGDSNSGSDEDASPSFCLASAFLRMSISSLASLSLRRVLSVVFAAVDMENPVECGPFCAFLRSFIS